MAVCYANLGSIERELGHFAETKRLFKRAIEITEKSFKPDHPNLATRYYNLSLVEQNLGNLEMAITLTRKAFLIFVKRPDTEERAQQELNWLREHDPNVKELLAEMGLDIMWLALSDGKINTGMEPIFRRNDRPQRS